MGDHDKTTGQQQPGTSQVGTHGNAGAGDRMDKGQGQSQGQGQNPGKGSSQGQGSNWSDQTPGYAGGTSSEDRDMTQGERTTRPQPDGTTPLEHEGRPKA